MQSRLASVCSVWIYVAAIALAATPALDVPFVGQSKAGCGSAAVAMVMEYWAQRDPGLDGAVADAERINKFLPPDSPKGIHGRELKQFLEQRGFQAFVINGEVQDLQHHFDNGRPVIVCFAPRGPHEPLHYAVIVGLDQRDVWMNDPARGKLFREPLPQFVSEWKATDNWALLAVPRLSR